MSSTERTPLLDRQADAEEREAQESAIASAFAGVDVNASAFAPASQFLAPVDEEEAPAAPAAPVEAPARPKGDVFVILAGMWIGNSALVESR